MSRINYSPTRFLLAVLPNLLILLALACTLPTHADNSFVVSPPQVNALIPQGRRVTIPVSLVGGATVVSWSVERVEGPSNGLIVKAEPIRVGGAIKGINLTIEALRPGGYYYALYVITPSKTSGQIVVHPAIVIPIRVLVPGVRVTLVSLKVYADRGIARVCLGLTPVGLLKLNLDHYDTIVRIYVDDKLVKIKHFTLRTGIVWCTRLGPYPQGSVHRVLVTAEAKGYSIDSILFKFIIGRISVHTSLSLQAPYITFMFFGGLVRTNYDVNVRFNTSLCSILVSAVSNKHKRLKQVTLQGKLGHVNTRHVRGSVTFYTPPLFPIPVSIINTQVVVKVSCLGLDRARVLRAYADTLALDLGVFSAYAAIAIAAYTAYRVARRRKRSRRGGGGGSRQSSE